jgi:hypothetical protein
MKLKRLFKTALHPLVRDNFTPDASVRAQQSAIEAVQLIALRKEGRDARQFDHFIAF